MDNRLVQERKTDVAFARDIKHLTSLSLESRHPHISTTTSIAWFKSINICRIRIGSNEVQNVTSVTPRATCHLHGDAVHVTSLTLTGCHRHKANGIVSISQSLSLANCCLTARSDVRRVYEASTHRIEVYEAGLYPLASSAATGQ